MKMRIRSKFIGILVLAAVLPVGVALITAEVLGYRSFRRTQGNLFQTRAQGLAESLRLTMSAPVEALNDWVALGEVAAAVNTEAARQPAIAEADLPEAVRAIEHRWPSLKEDDPLLSGILTNSLSARLRAFQAVNSVFAEALITDAQGRLIAATGKTSDYWQADESWWQRGFKLKPHQAVGEGIHYDNSARVYSLDVALPIREWQSTADKPAGVIKGVINASPLLASIGSEFQQDGSAHQVVLGDGRILARLNGPAIEPLSESVAPELVAKLAQHKSGWLVGPMQGNQSMVLGYAPLRFSQHLVKDVEITDLTPLFVVVSRPTAEVFGPVRLQIILLGLAGGVFLLAFTVAGYFITERHILRPLEALRGAAQALAGTARVDDSAIAQRPELPALEPLHQIKTGDELESVAQEFAYMAGRVLTYHDRLETEIALKTAEINRDLAMAREFQEALLPHSYPRVPTDAEPDAIALEFHHIYQPASTVGGDFFDVLKLSDHRAGIFIADVMGHGARSALVTAILRALLQNLAVLDEAPAIFLASLNRHFQEIIRNSPEMVFVTAFYLVIDTQAATATYASAGHPSPLLADRTTGTVQPLLSELRSNPALGLFNDATYAQWSRPVRVGEVFLLLTDGVHEASNAAGEEFGFDRLWLALKNSLVRTPGEVGQAVVAELHRFVEPEPLADDICLVTVEIAAAPAKLANVAEAQSASV